MKIGDVIRKYRRQAGITQEEMAKRLGVTAPAVNKWEKNNTQPDIALVAPIARLLGISTDTLLSYKESLSQEEIAAFVRKIDQDLEEKEYAEVFPVVRDKLNEYPNCELLVWQAAVIMNARLGLNHVPDQEQYHEQILEWFERCLQSEDELMRKRAAGSLFQDYMQKEDYSGAEHCLSYLSIDSPDRKLKEAQLCSKTGQRQEAFKKYEELLFSNYQFASMILNSLRILYMEDENHGMAKKLASVERKLASAFEMGKYHEVSAGLDVAAWEKDVDATAETVKQIVESFNSIADFTRSSLYQHMSFKETDPDFTERLRSKIIARMHDDESYSYMQGNTIWEEIIGEAREQETAKDKKARAG